MTDTVQLAMIAAIPPTIAALAALTVSIRNATSIKDVHVSINSRMDELVKASKAESKAEGVEQGRAEIKPLSGSQLPAK